MPSVLIVDDEVDLAELLDFNLRQAGFSTRRAHSGVAALESASQAKPDVVVLDLMLPDLSGVEVCRRLKADPKLQSVLVVMLTAKGEEPDRLLGFESGADDYVVKPFSVQELLLRLKAILRRTAPAQSADAARTLGQLTLDASTRRCWVEGREIPLTHLEFRLLDHLMERVGHVQSREVLLEQVWGLASSLETRTVDTHVMRLRDKLGPVRNYVETVRGIGYRMLEADRV